MRPERYTREYLNMRAALTAWTARSRYKAARTHPPGTRSCAR